MDGIDANLIKKHLLFKNKNQAIQYPFKGKQIQLSKSQTSKTDGQKNIRLLQAVYHRYKDKKAVKASKSVGSVDQVSHDELQQAMDEAKSAFDAMREVQEQINRAYKELIDADLKQN